MQTTTGKTVDSIQKKIISQSVAMIQKYMSRNNRAPCIAVVSTGNVGLLNWDLLDYYAKTCYVHIKKVYCPLGTKASEIMTSIVGLDKDESVDGIILNTPFENFSPEDEDFLSSLIVPDKDIMGQRYESMIRINKNINSNAFVPLIAESVLNLITENYGTDLRRILVTVIGRDNVVSKPLANMLINNNADVRWFHECSDPYAVCCDAADSDIIFTTKRMTPEFYESEMNSSRRILICWVLDGHFELAEQDRGKSLKVVKQFIGPGDLEQVIFTMLMNHVAKAYSRHMRKGQDE